jgi:predicted ATPase
MMNRTTNAALLGVLSLGILAGCSPAQQAQADRAVAAGQLFCAKATATGPLVVALADALGAPVVVTGRTASAVADACALIGAIPVVPPSKPADVPVVSVAR